MKPILNDIYKDILVGCIRSAEMSIIMESPFKYNNILEDIIINIEGEVYGDGITFQRGKLTKIDISSKVHKLTDEDKTEFKDKLQEEFWKIINEI